ncbi:metallophosphoesterase family protein [Algoriphagus chordae]|uniref:3',5'-cyclic AMP phosphodiesterase CpdA n=1 Tax=Algoriphagus chordae TaxID=237019 RepID=A0A2W7RCC6_9BACT|nr:metallophosphoesterase [Algoriphagus chordae]PZX56776.1 3',5'-cyclic AMP phosphodiesterase CpdA [Algoriphagus chordae]
MNRRIFIKNSALAGFSFALPDLSSELEAVFSKKITIGVIADLHQDLMHDGAERLSSFLTEVKKQSPDAILQLGDFAYPSDTNKALIDDFNNAHQHSLHVIGNHDTDSGFTKEQCLSVWGMPATYYTQDLKGIRLIVLDGNEKGSPSYTGGYVSFIGAEQINWLQKQLEKSTLPVLICCHQPLAGLFAVDNATEIQSLLGQYSDKILLCINGHSHIDQHQVINDVNYLHINSASYYWVGDDYKHTTFEASIIKEHPILDLTCPYEESLFAFLTIDPTSKTITVKGRRSKWVGKSPKELGYKIDGETDLYDWVIPEIKNLKISLSQ